jgi:type II secretory pathway pseudopilin PulG
MKNDIHTPSLETLTIVSIIFILVGLGLPVYQKAMDAARRTTQLYQARSFAHAMMFYAQDNNQFFPDAETSTEIFEKVVADGYLAGRDIPKKTMSQLSITGGGVHVLDSSERLPLIFNGGNAPLNYEAGESLTLDSRNPWKKDGIVVVYKDFSCVFRKATPEGIVKELITQDYDDEIAYVQRNP